MKAGAGTTGVDKVGSQTRHVGRLTGWQAGTVKTTEAKAHNGRQGRF